jgi:hypothetical protein
MERKGLTPELLARSFNIDIEKGKKTGYYTDTAENRKKGVVGQKYSKEHEEDPKKEVSKKEETKPTDKKDAKETEKKGDKSTKDSTKDTGAKDTGVKDTGVKEGKSENEIKLAKLEDDYKYYLNEQQEMNDYLEERQKQSGSDASKKLLDIMLDGVDEGDKVIEDLKNEIESLKSEIEEENSAETKGDGLSTSKEAWDNINEAKEKSKSIMDAAMDELFSTPDELSGQIKLSRAYEYKALEMELEEHQRMVDVFTGQAESTPEGSDIHNNLISLAETYSIKAFETSKEMDRKKLRNETVEARLRIKGDLKDLESQDLKEMSKEELLNAHQMTNTAFGDAFKFNLSDLDTKASKANKRVSDEIYKRQEEGMWKGLESKAVRFGKGGIGIAVYDINDDLAKGSPLPDGTVHEYGGHEYRKESGKWIYVGKAKAGKEEEKKSAKSSYHKGDSLDSFRDVANKSKDVDDFMNKVREIKNVPPDVADKFHSEYGGGSIKDAAGKLFNEVKGGKTEKKEPEKKAAEKMKGWKEGVVLDTGLIKRLPGVTNEQVEAMTGFLPKGTDEKYSDSINWTDPVSKERYTLYANNGEWRIGGDAGSMKHGAKGEFADDIESVLTGKPVEKKTKTESDAGKDDGAGWRDFTPEFVDTFRLQGSERTALGDVTRMAEDAEALTSILTTEKQAGTKAAASAGYFGEDHPVTKVYTDHYNKNFG